MKELITELRRYNNSLKREDWVPASYIIELTGWDKEGMRRARNRGMIEYRRRMIEGKQVIEYLLQSLPENKKVA